MKSFRSSIAFLALFALLATCDEADFSRFEVCRLKEITIDAGNIRGGTIPIISFEYNEIGQVTRIANHIWEQIEVTYEGGQVKNLLRMSFRYINPAIDTVSFDYSHQGNTILVTKTLLRPGADSLMERMTVQLEEGRIMGLERRAPTDELIMRFTYTWTNGNLTQMDGFNEQGQHRVEAIYEYDTGKNPLVQVGKLLVDPVFTSSNNFSLKTLRDPLTGAQLSLNPIPIAGGYNTEGFPDNVRIPFYAPGRNVGIAGYENCE